MKPIDENTNLFNFSFWPRPKIVREMKLNICLGVERWVLNLNCKVVKC